MDEIPCYDCLCMPVCKQKTYQRFFIQCKLIVEYYNKHIDELNFGSKYEFRKLYDYLVEEKKIFETKEIKNDDH